MTDNNKLPEKDLNNPNIDYKDTPKVTIKDFAPFFRSIHVKQNKIKDGIETPDSKGITKKM